jgi:LmbE family N-acetylglucosaminyl deacetylase
MMDYCTVKYVSRFFLLAWLLWTAARAERTPLAGTAELVQTLDRLNTLGSLLMVAAHPDDENTAVIAYFARGRHIRTAYLSATRGEGGQNLLGTEQGEALGLIRTQELLAARRIDGGEQFFTRVFDFGFSKSPEEALSKWGRELVLGDMVRVVRRFRPDVLVTRWSPTGGAGHGHHWAVGHLTPELFAAAGDPGRFPEQAAEGLEPWRPRRLVWVTSAFNGETEEEARAARQTVGIDAGQFDFLLGKSYAEVAAESRSRHSSQGFGSAEPKGENRQTFVHVAGEPAAKDLFDGVDTTWKRVPGSGRLATLVRQAREQLDIRRPHAILPLLFDAWREMARLRDPWVMYQRQELLRAIELAAGLQLDAAADRWDLTPGSQVRIRLLALHHGPEPWVWEKAEIRGVARVERRGSGPLQPNRLAEAETIVAIPRDTPYSQPYWLVDHPSGAAYVVRDPNRIGAPENPPVLEAVFYLRAAPDLALPFRLPVRYRWVDRARGELSRSVEIVPPVSVSFLQSAVLFSDAQPRRLSVRVTSHAGPVRGRVALETPPGWSATPQEAPFELPDRDQQATVAFEVRPPREPGGGHIEARARVHGATVGVGLTSIRYSHIPPQVFFPPARARVERVNVRMTSRNIGYVMGAGDEVPHALEQMGATVKLLTADDLTQGDLGRFDAVVTGVRALNVRDDLVASRKRLLDYVAAGGVLVVQYNTSRRAGPEADRVTALAPYPMTPSAERVSVEEAPVTFPNPDLPVMHHPNEITTRDFEGWVQERGLYFMADWDPRYKPVFAANDPGEPSRLGGTLYAPYGKGVYIYTAYSWFRQLPAGVPGAYRVFANLVSGGR